MTNHTIDLNLQRLLILISILIILIYHGCVRYEMIGTVSATTLLHSWCEHDRQCGSNAWCNLVKQVCTCRMGYHPTGNGADCEHFHCNSTADCKLQFWSNTECLNGACYCEQMIPLWNHFLLLREPRSQFCVSVRPCRQYAECVTWMEVCYDRKCVPNRAMYTPHGVIKRFNYLNRFPCDDDIDCSNRFGDNVQCNPNTMACDCSDGYEYSDSESVCLFSTHQSTVGGDSMSKNGDYVRSYMETRTITVIFVIVISCLLIVIVVRHRWQRFFATINSERQYRLEQFPEHLMIQYFPPNRNRTIGAARNHNLHQIQHNNAIIDTRKMVTRKMKMSNDLPPPYDEALSCQPLWKSTDLDECSSLNSTQSVPSYEYACQSETKQNPTFEQQERFVDRMSEVMQI
ncbi:hypothetical protein RDWZM_006131 [Blomia tropicalis]|uniref:Uncharacterized protein n=1 Tax=Blomia tropicalis TaxID=40697 RepID=A0A9Q0M7I0_BLOTA|nr:hypothetical protein RDWZM_006131 [Blomia tropicalis]